MVVSWGGEGRWYCVKHGKGDKGFVCGMGGGGGVRGPQEAGEPVVVSCGVRMEIKDLRCKQEEVLRGYKEALGIAR